MAGKVVLITGGSGGIGKAAAIGLAALGARLAITGRDLKRAEAAAVEIRGATRNPDVDAFAADLSSQAELRRLAAEVLDAYPRMDVLVNNVGGSWATRHITADGLERTFAVAISSQDGQHDGPSRAVPCPAPPTTSYPMGSMR